MKAPAETVLAQAMHKHLQGELDAAETLYREALCGKPDDAQAQHYLGFLLLQTNRLPEAVHCLQQAIAMDGNHAEWHFNLGIGLSRLDLHEEAIEAFSEAIALDNRQYFYWTNLGSAFEARQEWLRAEQCYSAASHIDSGFPDAYFLMSALYLKLERYNEARRCHHLAIINAPPESQSRILRGQAFYELGRQKEALAVFADWLAAEPNNPVAQHLLAAHAAQEIPTQCASRYIEQTFEEFAHSFDATLSRLHYSGPQLVAGHLAGKPIQNQSSMLDLGCGTGLIGATAKDYVYPITGVDLSQAMLEQARAKQCYQYLHKSDIVTFLRKTTTQYDLITCMDTLNYLGLLDEVFELIASRLPSNGSLLFTTEKLIGAAQPYQLNRSGRYSHRHEYIVAALHRSNLHISSASEVVLRIEAGTPIIGEFICAQHAT